MRKLSGLRITAWKQVERRTEHLEAEMVAFLQEEIDWLKEAIASWKGTAHARRP
ncbi:MAG: hypothetical protein K6U14_07300 [Firmicutes bacterium]|nr:hypothetical protein [Alicyclobacillaceae bacterium]MCL6497424.1 hypothetical protein [Bacillota bacterium]